MRNIGFDFVKVERHKHCLCSFAVFYGVTSHCERECVSSIGQHIPVISLIAYKGLYRFILNTLNRCHAGISRSENSGNDGSYQFRLQLKLRL